MKRIILAAAAGSAILLAGCSKKDADDQAPAEASPVAAASADAGTSSDAATGDAGAATDAAGKEAGSPNKGTSGGPQP